MIFKQTPEGFEEAKEFATKIGRLDEFNAIKDSYLQVHEANLWYNDTH